MELLLKQPLSCGPKSNNLSRLQRSSPVNTGSSIGEILYWQSAEKSEFRW